MDDSDALNSHVSMLLQDVGMPESVKGLYKSVCGDQVEA